MTTLMREWKTRAANTLIKWLGGSPGQENFCEAEDRSPVFSANTLPVPDTDSGFRLSDRSRKSLTGVHEDLVKLVEAALKLSPVDFVVIEGVRSKTRQLELLKAGASSTLNSRHLTGHAVDVAALVDGKVSWDWPLYAHIATAFKRAARKLEVEIEWGGDWESFKDGPHFQLPWSVYPK